MNKTYPLLALLVLIAVLATTVLYKQHQNKKIVEAINIGDIVSIKEYVANGISLNEKSGEETYLHIAVKNGQTEIASYLIELGINTEVRDKKGKTPLHIAASNNNPEIIKLLLMKEANIDAKDAEKFTPLHLATSKDSYSSVKLLIEKGADFNIKDKNGATAYDISKDKNYKSIANYLASKIFSGDLFSAIIEDDSKKVESALEKGINVNIKDGYGNTPLHEAVKLSKTNLIGKLLEKGADINSKNKMKQTPLHLAVLSGNKEVVDLLFIKGADATTKDIDGNTPPELSIKIGQAEIATLFAGLAYEEKIITAVKYGNSKKVNQLIQNGASANTKEKGGDERSLLHLAVINGQTEIMKALLQRRADVEARDKDGNTPLHLAAYHNNISAAYSLIKWRASTEARNKRGALPIHFAAMSGDKELLDLFVKELGDPPIRSVTINKGGKELYRITTEKKSARRKRGTNHRKNYKSLLKVKDKENYTLLHYAAMGGNKEIGKFLIRNKADVNAKNKDGKTPYDIAIKYNQKSVAPIFKGGQISDTICEALQNTEEKRAIELINDGADVNAKCRHFNGGDSVIQSLIMISGWHHSSFNAEKVLKLVLEKGADVENTMDSALQANNLNIIKLLVKHGYDINKANGEGYTHLHGVMMQAKMMGSVFNINIIEYFVKNTKNINAKDAMGETALSLAKQTKRQELVDMLVKAGAI